VGQWHLDLSPPEPAAEAWLPVKVLDFGIAKLLSAKDTGKDATRTGSLLGTPLYMSPEQCRGIPTIGHWADIYSLGCVMFETVAGRPPFVSEAPGDLLMAHISQAAPPLSFLQPDVPPEIESLVAQMLRIHGQDGTAGSSHSANQYHAAFGADLACGRECPTRYHAMEVRPSALGSTIRRRPKSGWVLRQAPHHRRQ
jgi:serine/threonine protein kinase